MFLLDFLFQFCYLSFQIFYFSIVRRILVSYTVFLQQLYFHGFFSDDPYGKTSFFCNCSES